MHYSGDKYSKLVKNVLKFFGLLYSLKENNKFQKNYLDHKDGSCMFLLSPTICSFLFLIVISI